MFGKKYIEICYSYKLLSNSRINNISNMLYNDSLIVFIFFKITVKLASHKFKTAQAYTLRSNLHVPTVCMPFVASGVGGILYKM